MPRITRNPFIEEGTDRYVLQFSPGDQRAFYRWLFTSAPGILEAVFPILDNGRQIDYEVLRRNLVNISISTSLNVFFNPSDDSEEQGVRSNEG